MSGFMKSHSQQTKAHAMKKREVPAQTQKWHCAPTLLFRDRWMLIPKTDGTPQRKSLPVQKASGFPGSKYISQKQMLQQKPLT
jgi:hypothetical protein